jgi:hypothetical protein
MRFIVFISLLISGCVSTTVVPIPESEKQVQFINEFGSQNKDTLFDGTIDWLAETFVDSKSVVEVNDRERGRIVGKGLTSFNMGNPGSGWGATFKCRFTVVIDVKDSRVRVTYKDFTMLDRYGIAVGQMIDRQYNNQVRENIARIHDGYVTYISRQRDEW